MSFKLRFAPLIAMNIALPAFAQNAPVSIPAQDFGPVWTGFYVGGAFGAGGMVNNLSTSGGGISSSFNGGGGSGVLGSIYGGIDYQILPKAIVGVLAEATLASISGTNSASVPGANASVTSQPNFGWAVLARAGLLANSSTLIYFTGGYAGQNFLTSGTATAGGATSSFSQSNTFNGWTVGPGVEAKLGRNWATKLEYRYSQFGTQNISGISVTPSTHALRAGLTYKFGGFGGAPSEDGPAFNEPAFNWTGFYGGVAAGAGMATGPVTASAGGASATFTGAGQGLLGGVFVGADYQFAPKALVGVMGDFTWSGMQTSTTIAVPGAGAYAAVSPNQIWSVMGRLGYLPIRSTLLYAAAGYTGMNVQATSTAYGGGTALFGQGSTTFSGWTVGPGIETVITGGWTTRLEYRYSQYEQKQITSSAFGGATAGVTAQPSTHTIRLGLAYKFGVGADNKSIAESPE
ncbi:MAG: outer membrane beta-barrel protein [Reyranella sp.]|nr:outer membrane beta-barrel protein [Reyranella sp.]